ncbi:hypothetical protein QTI66_12755 [Variovorax sp. J22R133]|uniref:hypothetical protein n=1 Tax=Variovorax brevis TaxID=3053503 RepID=UPI0025776338|nr:hypothetical protein [Variovorax sp. J22R133]MDM0113021.1 hypothetical protein [Variovorax sp. J22R133]
MKLHWAVLAAATGLVASLAFGQGAPAQQAAPAGAPRDKLSVALPSVGIKRCQPAMARLSALSLQGSRNHDLLLDWDRKRPDNGAVFAFLGIEYPNAGVAAAINAFPEADGSCTVAAERISVAPFTCASIAQQELTGYQMTRLLPIYVVYVDPKEPNSSVSLIDSPPGCLVIRRFVEYSWKDPAAAAPAAPARR